MPRFILKPEAESAEPVMLFLELSDDVVYIKGKRGNHGDEGYILTIRQDGTIYPCRDVPEELGLSTDDEGRVRFAY